jgi:hypothetical protein
VARRLPRRRRSDVAEQNSFKTGGGGDVQNKPGDAWKDKDEYGGGYKDAADGLSEAQKFGTDQLPVQNDSLPAKGLKGVGG